MDEQFEAVTTLIAKNFKKEMDELKKELEENKAKIFTSSNSTMKNSKKQMEELQKDLKENKIKPEDLIFTFLRKKRRRMSNS